MPERDTHRERVKKLLAQDQEINESQLKEFRMKLQESLESWEQGAKKVRRSALIALVVLASSYACLFLGMMLVNSLHSLDAHKGAAPMILGYAGGALYLIAALTFFGSLFLGVYFLGLYFFKYAPGLKRARFDVQTTLILELQKQVEQLRQDQEQKDK